MMQADPLFKIIFRDELTSRKYRRRIEDIINYVMTTELNEDPAKDYDDSANLVLEVYDPVEVNQLAGSTEQQSSNWQNTTGENVNNKSKKRKLDKQESIIPHIKREKDIDEYERKPQVKQTIEHPPQNAAHEPEQILSEKSKKPKHHHIEETNVHQFQPNPLPEQQPKYNPVPEPQIEKPRKHKTLHVEQPLPAKSPQLVPDVGPELNFLRVRNKLETAFKNMISLKIGLNDYYIKDKNVYFSNETGLTIRPKADDRLELIHIRLDEILRVLVHLPKVKPSIFIFVTHEAMRRGFICSGINELNEPYVDLRIKDMICNCITVLPDLINTKSTNILREIFKNTDVVDIDENTAKDLLAIIPAAGSKGPMKPGKEERIYSNLVEKCAKFLPKSRQQVVQNNVNQHRNQERSRNRSFKNTSVPQPVHHEHYAPPQQPQYQEPPQQPPHYEPQHYIPPHLQQQSYHEPLQQRQQPEPPVTPPAINQANNIQTSENNDNNAYESAEAVFCRVIRVGSHEYAKKRMFSITKSGIKFCVPHPKSSAMITLTIKLYQISKISIGCSKNLPVLFIYIYPKVAEEIRSVLMMSDPNGPYIDPLSRDETLNKIIILPERVLNNNRLIEKLSSHGKIEQLDEPTTNNILSRSLPSNIDLFHKLSKKVKKMKVKQEKVEITLK